MIFRIGPDFQVQKTDTYLAFCRSRARWADSRLRSFFRITASSISAGDLFCPALMIGWWTWSFSSCSLPDKLPESEEPWIEPPWQCGDCGAGTWCAKAWWTSVLSIMFIFSVLFVCFRRCCFFRQNLCVNRFLVEPKRLLGWIFLNDL